MQKFMNNIAIVFVLIIKAFSRTFKYYDYPDILSTFQTLATTCPHYIKIDTSQSRYNLDSVPGCGEKNCSNLIVYLTDFNSYTISRPQFYISGLLHGNEVLGPTSITEFALYFCTTPRTSKSHQILKSKLFIMTPSTNAFGYYNNIREDKIMMDGISSSRDPNRDFSYFKSSRNESPCMETITGRTINEIFNEHIITGGITFHGGTNVLGYAWGNNLHLEGKGRIKKSTEAPDFNGFNEIGKSMRDSSSSKSNKENKIKDYVLGDMTSLVYPVDGGLEDWAYAGTWENKVNKEKPIKKCIPKTFSHYETDWSGEKYNPEKLKCLMYLAEAADDKKPKGDTLGNDKYTGSNDIFDFEKITNFYGHIPRNMRLIYTGADLISATIYIENKLISKKEDKIIIPFTFMGCKTLKNYTVYKFPFDKLNKTILTEGYLKEQINSAERFYSSKTENDLECYWNNFKKVYNIEIEKKINNKTTTAFNTKLKGDIYFILGESPDQSWENQTNPDPNVGPQSHIVLSKISPNYSAKNGNYSLNSNYYIYSCPIIVFENDIIIVVDDIDALFFENNEDLDLITYPFSTKSQIFSKVNLNITTEPGETLKSYLSSQLNFNISFQILLSKKKFNPTSKNYLKEISNETSLLVNFAESDINSNLFFREIKCLKGEYEEITYITCKEPFSSKTVSNYFLKEKIVNSFISMKETKKKESFGFIGIFSLDSITPGNFAFIEANNKLTCSPFYYIKNEVENYKITITNVSNKKFMMSFASVDISSPYIIIFPFIKYFVVITKENLEKEILVELKDEISSKIIGKTVYAVKVTGDKGLNFIQNLLLKNENFFAVIKEIIQILPEEAQMSRCSIVSNKIYNSENLEAFKNITLFPHKNQKKNFTIFYFLMGFCLFVLIVVMAVLVFWFFKKVTCFKGYKSLKPRTGVEAIEITIR